MESDRIKKCEILCATFWKLCHKNLIKMKNGIFGRYVSYRRPWSGCGYMETSISWLEYANAFYMYLLNKM